MSDALSETFRAECEARYWLEQTGANPGRINTVIEQIAKRRGKRAANALLDQMRKQWKMKRGV